ncbi:hypothetical protein D3C86_1438770 [compost metagenome]
MDFVPEDRVRDRRRAYLLTVNESGEGASHWVGCDFDEDIPSRRDVGSLTIGPLYCGEVLPWIVHQETRQHCGRDTVERSTVPKPPRQHLIGCQLSEDVETTAKDVGVADVYLEFRSRERHHVCGRL